MKPKDYRRGMVAVAAALAMLGVVAATALGAATKTSGLILTVCKIAKPKNIVAHQVALKAGLETTLRVTGPLGETVIEVKGNQARVVQSPCP
jgi:hypothetical protein